MRADQARSNPIATVLDRAGIKPAKVMKDGRELRFSSPLRNADKTPSFKVDTAKNLWYHHGLARGGNKVTVWDVDTKKPKRTLVHDVNVYAATFSPDGKQIATGDKEGRIRIWASEGGETVSIATPGRVEGRYVEPACDEVTGGVAVARARWIYTNSDGTQELQLSLLCRKKGSGPYVPQGVLASTQYAEAPKLRKISPEQLKLAVATTEHMGWKASPEDLAFYGEKYPDSNSLNKEPVSIRILVDQARAGKALDVMLRLPGLSDLDAAFAEAQQQARKAGAYAN